MAILGVVLAGVPACRPTTADWQPTIDRPADLLPEDVLVAVLVDIHLAEGDALEKALPTAEQTELLQTRYGDILAIHRIEPARFARSFQWYLDQPVTMHGVYGRVIEELTRLQGEVESRSRGEATPAEAEPE